MPSHAATTGVFSGTPSICSGNGGKAVHLREFALQIDKVGQHLQDALRLDEPWPRKQCFLQDLKDAVGNVHGWHDCLHCQQDRRNLGLLDPLDTLWRRLQDPRGCERQPLEALSVAISNFLSPQQMTLIVSTDDTSQLWFTHDSVRPLFSHGHLQGRTVESYVDELVEHFGERIEANVVPDIHLHVVFHHGRYKSFGNRRAWAMREASRRLGRSLRVQATVHPLVPGEEFTDGSSTVRVLKKFEVSHSTKTNGNPPSLRVDSTLIPCHDAATPPEETLTEPTWLAKYRSAKGFDDKLLRTSTLPLLDKMASVARHIVEGSERIFLMSGSTGCGKSTQVPQGVYDYVRNRDGPGRGPSIVCTQPRRVAACSLDEGVHNDRVFREVWPEEFGNRITAHQIGGETNKTSGTRLLYCTAGVLLQMLRSSGHQGVRQFHYIFLDEVHERSMDDDLLIGFLCSKRFLEETNMKIIVMSATLSISTFFGYLQSRFGSSSRTVGTICLDRADHLDKLSPSELQWLAEAAGVDLSGCEDQCHEDLVQLMVQAQVVRPHPMRLQYLDDLLYPIVHREGFLEALEQNGLNLRPVGITEPQLFGVADEAWKATINNHRYQNREPLEVMIEIVENGPLVISDARELFAKEFCCKLMQQKPRKCSVPLVNLDELACLRSALPMDGPPCLNAACALAGGFIPQGSLITSYQSLADNIPRLVHARNDLPESCSSPMLIFFASLVAPTGIGHSPKEAPPYVALMFLPGISMISDFQYALQDTGGLPVDEVYTLHSKVKQEQQALAVQQIERGRRAILANNIAESSITVPNADVVIDLCLQRTMRWNEDRQGQLLDFDLATKDSLNQRAGRVARTKAGMVVRLITREEFDLQPDSRQPEMLRRPVDKVLLKIINMAPSGSKRGVDAKSEIRACISPPQEDKIAEALTDLQSINAVQCVGSSHFKALRLGALLDDLPVDIRFGLIVAWGVELGLEAVTVDAAAMLHAYNVVGEPRPTFQDGGIPFIEHCACLRKFSNGFPSDVVMLTNLLRSFRHQARLTDWVEGTQDDVAIQKMQKWCSQNSANYQSLVSLSSTVREIHKQLKAMLPLPRLDSCGSDLTLEERWLTDEESMYLMFLFCGSFHRNMQQVRGGAKASFSLADFDDERDEWENHDVVIAYDNSRSKRDTQRCITNFFLHRRCGIYGRVVDSGMQGSKGGWVRIRLEPCYDPEEFVYGFPREVTDVLKLRRDFNKLCGDGDTTMEILHKASTRAVPVFWRWESLTEKRTDIVLQSSSVVTTYLETSEMSRSEIHAAICAMDFESFHVKSQDRWQKAEGLTLLPCIRYGSATAHHSFPEVLFAVFGNQNTRRLGVTSLPFTPLTGTDVTSIRTLLTGQDCVLQKFGDGTEIEWRQQTRSLHSLLKNMFDAYGGFYAFKTLARPVFSAAAPHETSDSDLSDSMLVDSEPESPLLCRGHRHKSATSHIDEGPGAGVFLLLDFHYWWLFGKDSAGDVHCNAEWLQDCVLQLEEKLGPITNIIIFAPTSLPHFAGISNASSDQEERLKAALLRIEAEVLDSTHASLLKGKDLQIKEFPSVGIALALHALEYAGCLQNRELTVQPGKIVLLTEPTSLTPLLPAINRQNCVDVRIATCASLNELSLAIPATLRERSIRINPPKVAQRRGLQAAPSATCSQFPGESSQVTNQRLLNIPPGKRKGDVIRFDQKGGYGFISGDKASNGANIYMPMKNCVEGYLPSVGDAVFYKLGKQPDGKKFVANLVEKAT